jgi:hypothetical protein
VGRRRTRDSAGGLTHYQKLVIGLEIRGKFKNRVLEDGLRARSLSSVPMDQVAAMK